MSVGGFHANLVAKGKGSKDWNNSWTEHEYLGVDEEGKHKFGVNLSTGHKVFKDKADGQWKKRKLTDNRPGAVVIQGAKCCVEVYPYYAKFFDVDHEEVRVEEERWVVQRLRQPQGDWRDVGAWNPVLEVEEYSEPAGNVIKVSVTYETNYGPFTVEYFQRDGNALKHNVYFTNESGGPETFRVLQRWAGIVGSKCNGKTKDEFGVKTGTHHSEILPRIISHQPESVLDLGGGKGDVVKLLNERGISATCMDYSEYCWDNRVTDNFVQHDATVIPWPFTDNEFDLCVGIGSLKHIPEEHINSVLREINRISRRGSFFLGPGIFIPPELTDIVLNKPYEWWDDLFKSIIPDFPAELLQIDMRTENFLAFHREGDSPRKFTISENLHSMVHNEDGTSKISKCLQRPLVLDVHPQGLKMDFVYSDWVLAQGEELEIDPDTATISPPTEDGVVDSTMTQTTNGPAIAFGRLSPKVAYNRGYVEWDVSGIPVDVTITDTVFKYHGEEYREDGHIHAMAFQPTMRTAAQIWTDIGDGVVYTAPSPFPVVAANQSEDLGAAADADLQGQLGVGWFAIGLQSDDEESAATLSAIWSEDKTDAATPKPTLYVVYDLPAAGGDGAGAVVMGTKSLILDLLLEGVI